MSDRAWITTETKDGKQKLERPFYATNPRYIEVHNQWKWELVDYDLAVAEMFAHQFPPHAPAHGESHE
ncbi:hypothetical protein LMG19089_02929 [Ralstonia edaphis]|uniref:hypothetical protein n=1 Tax=Ralstonia edaphi TaxID=3058599 RepID=UPI0028F5EF79|nr:hypothetical protein [Ralstonia sp. LMG 6871]CAJ0701799.1 hypothetical protein LMG19089_02929 [Ralstonia sp. LMG 6871]